MATERPAVAPEDAVVVELLVDVGEPPTARAVDESHALASCVMLDRRTVGGVVHATERTPATSADAARASWPLLTR